MIIFFYDRKHSTFCQWEYMHSSHAHLKWHFKGWIGPRRHRSLGNLSGHQVASKAADSESCLDWTQEAPKMHIHTTGINTTCDVWDHFRHSESSWFFQIISLCFMIFQDAWFAKLLSRKGWANRLVDLVAVAALTFIEVDQLEVAGCGDFGVSAESLIHDDDSWWLLMVPDVAFPGPKDIGSQCCLVYPIEVPTTFPDYLSTGSSFFWSDGKICRRPLCFMVKSM